MNGIHEELKEIKHLLKEIVKMLKSDREIIATQSDLDLTNFIESKKAQLNNKGKFRRLLRTFKKYKNKSKGCGIGSAIEGNIVEKETQDFQRGEYEEKTLDN